ncbi:MAG TPA: glycosyltransferase [Planctomycetota bacterium]|nr:glycosyltransferase [Planctomycetota bacterium]
MAGAVDLSIIAPMFNEAENVAETARRVREALAAFPGSWELVMVDDGSTDASRARAEAEAARDPRIRVAGYTPNAGRGRALRTGFAAARGRFVVSVDFDLSYEPSHILRLHAALAREGGPDLVLASAYMPGGTSEGVSWRRLLPSRLGNWLLRFAWPKRIYTSTCIVRGYRREALERLALAEDGKEIHLEILSQAFDRGLRVEEIPGHLRARARGKSKARLGGTIGSHLRFLARRRPGLCVGVGAAALAAAGLVVWALIR